MISNKNISNKTFFLITLLLFFFQACNSTNVNNPYAEKREQRADIFDFNTCVQAGNSVTRSFPPQCRTKDGRIFMNYSVGRNKNTGDSEIIEKDSMESCKDKCGDGVCQEIVCMALGCPCPESKESCPEDCN